VVKLLKNNTSRW